MAAVGMLLDPFKVGREAKALEGKLRKRIVGQDEAIRQIVGVYQTYLAGLNNPGAPVGSFLFLGPTGSGKTRTVEAVAEALTGDARAAIKIDCGEYQHGHEIAKLVGSPPGYLGHRETHPLLCQEALNQYQTENMKLSFLLFDEIEKASDALWNLLLGILDKATLTLGDNRRVDFSRAMIFLTSNLGAREIESLARPRLGFAPVGPWAANDESSASATEHAAKVSHAGVDAARRRFSPEFMNRLDKVVVFHPLAQAELRGILGLELNLLRDRIQRAAATNAVQLEVSEAVQDFLLREGTDARYGARHLKRTLERLLVQPLASLIATGQIQAGDGIYVELDGTAQAARLVFFKTKKGPAGRPVTPDPPPTHAVAA
ncbi:MAG: ATP-dependent Clp protease ATP-binding subunit [Acidobacteriia bacterium]|nr:ATP-dependent Clp protease ATP-binding subunit [Terriglobia bacterium]MBV9746210.1 ATP-dependent Clp protease ATP-binding subunit [Terriglobia bacterium]